MKDIGLGILDPYTVVIVLVTLVLAQVLLGYPVPLDTTNATSLFISLAIFTGYIYLARSIIRAPVMGIKAFLYINEKFDPLGALQPHGRWFVYLKSFFRNLIGFFRHLWLLPVYWLLLVFDFSGAAYQDANPDGRLRPLLENKRLRFILNILDRSSIIIVTFLVVLPPLQGYLNGVGIAGIIFMTVLFVFRGDFSGLIQDELQTKINAKPAPKIDAVIENTQVFQPVVSEKSTIDTIDRLGIQLKVSSCAICGKRCTAQHEDGSAPLVCSDECRKKWFFTWDRDWCIGSGKPREVINKIRLANHESLTLNGLAHTHPTVLWVFTENPKKNSLFIRAPHFIRAQKKVLPCPIPEPLGYENLNFIETALAELEKLASEGNSSEQTEAVWAMLGMQRDISIGAEDRWRLDRERMISNVLAKLYQDKPFTYHHLEKALTDESDAVIQSAINIIEKNPPDLEKLNKRNIWALLKHHSWSIRHAAIRVLGQAGQLKAIYEHLGQQGHSDDQVVIDSLRLYGKESIPLLRNAQTHHFKWIREKATQALIDLGIDTVEPEMVIQNFKCPNRACRKIIEIKYPNEFDITQDDIYQLNFFQRSKFQNSCKYCGTKIGLRLALTQMQNILQQEEEAMKKSRFSEPKYPDDALDWEDRI